MQKPLTALRTNRYDEFGSRPLQPTKLHFCFLPVFPL